MKLRMWKHKLNLMYWFANCKCQCKSCYELRKGVKADTGWIGEEE